VLRTRTSAPSLAPLLEDDLLASSSPSSRRPPVTHRRFEIQAALEDGPTRYARAAAPRRRAARGGGQLSSPRKMFSSPSPACSFLSAVSKSAGIFRFRTPRAACSRCRDRSRRHLAEQTVCRPVRSASLADRASSPGPYQACARFLAGLWARGRFGHGSGSGRPRWGCGDEDQDHE